MCSDCFFAFWQTPRGHPVLPLHSAVRPGAVLSAVRLGHGPAGWTAHQHRKHEPQTAGPGPGPVPLSETGSYGACVCACVCVPKRWLEWYLWKYLLVRKSGISFATFSIVLYHLWSTRNTTAWLLKEHCIAVCSAVCSAPPASGDLDPRQHPAIRRTFEVACHALVNLQLWVTKWQLRAAQCEAQSAAFEKVTMSRNFVSNTICAAEISPHLKMSWKLIHEFALSLN